MNASASDGSTQVPCCPVLAKDTGCDVLDFHYRTRHITNVTAGGRRIQVEVLIHARLERCPGPMTLGDLVYSTTLLPRARGGACHGIGSRLAFSSLQATFEYPHVETVPSMQGVAHEKN